MKPGREIDEIIAEKVLGWNKLTPEDYEKSKLKKSEFYDCWWGVDKSEVLGGLPDFSIDIGDAWLVVDEMKKRGYYFAVSNGPVSHDDGSKAGAKSIWAAFGLEGEYLRTILGDTEAHAICLAALDALETK